MRKTIPVTILVGVAIAMSSCGGAQGSSGGAAPVTAPDASSFTAHGLTITRPDGWTFIEPDGSMTADTVIVLQGPMGEEALAPAIEITRRPLDARSRRRKPAHVLTQMTTEIVQLYDGFEMKAGPEEVDLAGQEAARLQLTFTETLPDGVEAKRGATFYGIVHQDSIWVIRCLGAVDGSNDPEFASIVNKITLAG